MFARSQLGDIQKLVLNCGALQPLINLLSSVDMESRREAALLLGQFANVQDPDYKSKIVQRGAGPADLDAVGGDCPGQRDGRLCHQQARPEPGQPGCIIQAGGLRPLLMLGSFT